MRRDGDERADAVRGGAQRGAAGKLGTARRGAASGRACAHARRARGAARARDAAARRHGPLLPATPLPHAAGAGRALVAHTHRLRGHPSPHARPERQVGCRLYRCRHPRLGGKEEEDTEKASTRTHLLTHTEAVPSISIVSTEVLLLVAYCLLRFAFLEYGNNTPTIQPVPACPHTTPTTLFFPSLLAAQVYSSFLHRLFSIYNLLHVLCTAAKVETTDTELLHSPSKAIVVLSVPQFGMLEKAIASPSTTTTTISVSIRSRIESVRHHCSHALRCRRPTPSIRRVTRCCQILQ